MGLAAAAPVVASLPVSPRFVWSSDQEGGEVGGDAEPISRGWLPFADDAAVTVLSAGRIVGGQSCSQSSRRMEIGTPLTARPAAVTNNAADRVAGRGLSGVLEDGRWC